MTKIHIVILIPETEDPVHVRGHLRIDQLKGTDY